MNYFKDYMMVEKKDFKNRKPGVDWIIFPDAEKQNRHFAELMTNRISEANKQNKNFAVVLPTGPIDYQPFVDLINKKKISMKNTYIFMMDEYCADEKNLIDENHPLSFRKFIRSLLYSGVKEPLRIPYEQLMFPDPANPAGYGNKIQEVGGLDITFGGFGVNGHLAFNDPPEDPALCTEENVKNSVTRVLSISRETVTQNAIGGTRGLLELVPPLAITIGMKEMLASREIHLYMIRKWHSGILRRCLFGTVDPKVPGSYVQQHPKVTVCMPEYVAELPMVVVTLDI
ncbi:MAG: hypothetical protein A2096_10495 [Spirochaetes bacterium GWF1_41_5]|nr:MAG: hypothetical protein A2096_10495 [Spirochaetes bacterium GWF1_41_5]HBE04431.1 glucosamine-6-phosphate isomerase [Spirochaetia bacterium]